MSNAAYAAFNAAQAAYMAAASNLAQHTRPTAADYQQLATLPASTAPSLNNAGPMARILQAVIAVDVTRSLHAELRQAAHDLRIAAAVVHTQELKMFLWWAVRTSGTTIEIAETEAEAVEYFQGEGLSARMARKVLDRVKAWAEGKGWTLVFGCAERGDR